MTTNEQVESILSKSIMSSERFIEELEKILSKNGGDLIDAVVALCEKNDMEIEAGAALVKQNSKLKAKLQSEAEGRNLIRKKAERLPV